MDLLLCLFWLVIFVGCWLNKISMQKLMLGVAIYWKCNQWLKQITADNFLMLTILATKGIIGLQQIATLS